jgi:hypothetical protein
MSKINQPGPQRTYYAGESNWDTLIGNEVTKQKRLAVRSSANSACGTDLDRHPERSGRDGVLVLSEFSPFYAFTKKRLTINFL